jgi:anti-sigma regulatory factor (Ser/Thr protein kinase)
VSQAVALVTAELAVNAITHGRLLGRDLRLSLLRRQGRVRVEVTDARPERLPSTAPAAEARSLEADAGRGLLLVSTLRRALGLRGLGHLREEADIACPH